MFIGRKEELNFLEERYESQNGELIVLYGRRRVGKTETLRKFCEKKPHVFFACTESPDEQQLTSFSERILQKGIPAAQYIKRFSNWKLALTSVLELPNDQKKLLVIDEFPYMVKGNNAIPSILQNLWDENFKDQNVMIVLCGSSMSFIEKEILAEKNPLYGRATGILKMNEMSFYDAIQFVPNYSVFDKITTYAILGGIPHYLKQFDDTLPIAKNIERSILTRGSILYSEVEFLMHQELRETATYNVVIEAVALGNTKLNDIYQKTQIEKTKLSVYLKNLMALNLITREFPVANSIKEHANIHRGLYQITDQFFRFWYAFVFPNLSELEAGDAKGIWKFAIEPQLDRYTSYVFEDVCREYLRLKNQNEMLPFHFTKIGRWWNKTDELDIMATDSKKKTFIVGECKYKNSDCTLSDYKNMKEKFASEGTSNKTYYWLFSKNGFSEELVKIAIEQNVTLVTADDIVNEMKLW